TVGTKDDFVRCQGGTLHVVDARQQRCDRFHPGIDRLTDAATLLNAEHLRLTLAAIELDEMFVLDQMNGLPCLAAKADENVSSDVGMLGEARQCAIELQMIVTAILHRTASLVGDGYHAIDIGEVL